MSTINIHFHKDSNPDITIYNNDYCESESETDSETESETDSESESESESERRRSETLDDPKPYHGDGFRVYFDTHKDREFFLRAFGFN
jgi:hypothetical protein